MSVRFPFTDLHSFKDFVVYAQTYLPDRFPPRLDGAPENQWSLESAFFALRHGLEQAKKECGTLPELEDCCAFVADAETSYREGDRRAGFIYLENVSKTLRRIETK